MRLSLCAAVILALLSGVAVADPSNVTDTVSSAALSTVSGNCLAANALRRSLTLDNSANTVNVGYCEAATVPAGKDATACTAAIGSGGTTTLTAGAIHYWRAGSAPQNMICFIAASSTPTITFREGY